MKVENLKKIILLGLTSLLCANFSVCAMEEKNEIKEENIDIKNTDQIINQISDMDPWDNFNYLSARSIYMNEKEKYERMKKIYKRLDKENIEKDTEKFMNNHHFSDIYDNCYEKIIDYIGFNNEPEESGPNPETGNTDLVYKSTTFKKLDEAIDLIKDINHTAARSLLKQLKVLRKKVNNLFRLKYMNDIFEKHFCYTLKTIYYEAKYCLDYLKKTTGVKSSESEFAKKFLEFLKELEKKRYADYDYWPDKNKIKGKFNEYMNNKYGSYSGILDFVKELCYKYAKLKEMINRTHERVKFGEDYRPFWLTNDCAVLKEEFNNENDKSEYTYRSCFFYDHILTNEDGQGEADMVSDFLDDLEKMAENLEDKNLIK